MSNDLKEKKQKCIHKNPAKSNKKMKYPYKFCPNCGSIIWEENYKKYITIKPLNMEKKTEYDPIEIALTMKEKSRQKDNQENSVNHNYIKKRKKVLIFLQKLSIKMKFSDMSFYHSLYNLDNILNKLTENEELSTKQLYYITIGYFNLCSKFDENDIFEPDFSEFTSIDDKHLLTTNEMFKYEMKCLELISYDLTTFSAYDWLLTFLYNGILFEDEIQGKPNNTVTNIYNFSKKMLANITSKSFFIKYSPFIISFSIVMYSREKNLPDINEKYDEILRKFYRISTFEYEDCLEDIKDDASGKKKDSKSSKDLNSISNKNKKSTISGNNYSTKDLEKLKIEELKKSDINEKVLSTNEVNNNTNLQRKDRKNFKTQKLDNKIDIKKVNNSDKIKNSEINNIEQFNRSGTFGSQHQQEPRKNKPKGTILVTDNKDFKAKLKEKSDEYFKSEGWAVKKEGDNTNKKKNKVTFNSNIITDNKKNKI